MIITKKNRREICKYLFQGGLVCKEGLQPSQTSLVDVPNLQVIKLMQSFKFREYVRETFAWKHYYWYLTHDGIEFLLTFLNLPSEIVPATLKKIAKAPPRQFGSGPTVTALGGHHALREIGQDMEIGDGYCAGHRPGVDFGGKGGAPAEYQPSFRGAGGSRHGFGCGGGGYGAGPAPSLE